MKRALLIIEVDGKEGAIVVCGGSTCKTLWWDEAIGKFLVLHCGCWVTLKEIQYLGVGHANV